MSKHLYLPVVEFYDKVLTKAKLQQGYNKTVY
jgi:hypothetical protein